MNSDDLAVEELSAADYLKFKETVFDEKWYASSQQPESLIRILGKLLEIF